MQAWKEKYVSYIQNQKQPSPPPSEPGGKKLSLSLSANLEKLLHRLGQSGDLVVRDFLLFGRYRAALVFFSSLVNQEQIQEHILKPLMARSNEHPGLPDNLAELSHYIWNTAVQVTQGTTEEDLSALPSEIVKGRLILLTEGSAEALVLDMRQVDTRGVEQTEQVIRGPREGYVEKLENNLSLLRYRLQSTDFRIEISPIGSRTQSRLALCYLDSLADPKLVSEGRAEQFMDVKPPLQRVPTLYVLSMMEKAVTSGKFPPDYIGSYWSADSKWGQSEYLPYVALRNKDNVLINGLAYFSRFAKRNTPLLWAGAARVYPC